MRLERAYITSVQNNDANIPSTGYIPPGLPQVQFPHFSAENNSVGFLEMIRRLGSGVIVVPLIGVLENIAICKAFGNI